MEYDKLLTLANSLNQPQFREAVNDANSRSLIIKRKYEELFSEESSPVITTEGNDVVLHEKAMQFVIDFKEKRAEENKRMDWAACFKQGTELNIFTYKNPESLRQQFTKYSKGKSKETK